VSLNRKLSYLAAKSYQSAVERLMTDNTSEASCE